MTTRNKGQSLLELIIAIGIFVAVIGGLSFFIFDNYISGRLSYEITQANFLAEEGIEAIKSIRDNNFGDLTVGNHGLTISNGHWILQGTEEDLSSQITAGRRVNEIENIDQDRKKITTKVTWQFLESRTEEVKLVTYLTNWSKIIGDWTQPKFIGSYNAPGNSDGTDLFFSDNKVYLVTANNSGSASEFYVIDVLNPSSPTLLGSLNLGSAASAVTVSGDYAFVASASNNRELQIINVQNPNLPSLVGSYNTSGNSDGLSIAVSGDTGYLGRVASVGPELLILNVSNPASVNLLGSYEIGGRLNDIYFDSDRVFLATSRTSQEFQLVDVLNPASPSQISNFNIGGNANSVFYSSGKDLAFLTSARNNQELVIIGPGP